MELKICRKAQFKRINIDGVANLRGNYHIIYRKWAEFFIYILCMFRNCHIFLL